MKQILPILLGLGALWLLMRKPRASSVEVSSRYYNQMDLDLMAAEADYQERFGPAMPRYWNFQTDMPTGFRDPVPLPSN